MLTLFIKLVNGDTIQFKVKSLAAYDTQGLPIVPAESFRPEHCRAAILGNPMENKELEDIILSNGFPCREIKDVTDDFPSLAPGSKVFRTK